ncbi:MAG: hypothetical protein ACR2PF_06735 [Rhizobiaceae bacterium]
MIHVISIVLFVVTLWSYHYSGDDASYRYLLGFISGLYIGRYTAGKQ